MDPSGSWKSCPQIIRVVPCCSTVHSSYGRSKNVLDTPKEQALGLPNKETSTIFCACKPPRVSPLFCWAKKLPQLNNQGTETLPMTWLLAVLLFSSGHQRDEPCRMVARMRDFAKKYSQRHPWKWYISLGWSHKDYPNAGKYTIP